MGGPYCAAPRTGNSAVCQWQRAESGVETVRAGFIGSIRFRIDGEWRGREGRDPSDGSGMAWQK